MSNFEYSNEALDILNLFYNKDVVIYVEGDDDILFWDNYLALLDFSAQIKDVGGKENLEPYIQSILEDNVKIIVAVDSDYSDITETKYNHPLIVYTYGYSIENTLYCKSNINRTICKYLKEKNDYDEEVAFWIETFETQALPLLKYDLANIKFDKSVSIMGDNCSRFLTTRKSHDLSSEKIQEYIETYNALFTEEELKWVEENISNYDKKPYYLIRGHFITNALINFIKNIVRKKKKKNIAISYDALYSAMISECKNSKCDCDQKKNYTHQIKEAMAYIEV
ncbi:DUF4435 domain-containing protein [Desulfocicer niacini]